MAWSSDTPRKSGVFIIEIIEKAKQNIISEQFNAITDKISKATSGVIPNMGLKEQQLVEHDAIGPGDSFRLRSMKFPDYELGLTSVKIKHEVECFYLGLRKVIQNDASTSKSEWSQKSVFFIK